MAYPPRPPDLAAAAAYGAAPVVQSNTSMRIAAVVLSIFASLAAFALLPADLAFTLTAAIVVIGALTLLSGPANREGDRPAGYVDGHPVAQPGDRVRVGSGRPRFWGWFSRSSAPPPPVAQPARGFNDFGNYPSGPSGFVNGHPVRVPGDRADVGDDNGQRRQGSSSDSPPQPPGGLQPPARAGAARAPVGDPTRREEQPPSSRPQPPAPAPAAGRPARAPVGDPTRRGGQPPSSRPQPPAPAPAPAAAAAGGAARAPVGDPRRRGGR